jgi:hypothetical protein
MLLARIYEILPLLCPRCSSPLKIVSFITQPPVIQRILCCLGETVEPPPLAPAKPWPLRLPIAARGRGPPPTRAGEQAPCSPW